MSVEPAQSGSSDDSPASIELAPGILVPKHTLRFSFSRSAGPGGQNVNRRATKAELRIALDDLPLTDAQLDRLRFLATSWLVCGDEEGEELLITSDEHRTQRRNRQTCLDRLREVLLEAITPPKVRKKTRPGKSARERRLKQKREVHEKKQRRRWRED